ncbi:MAG: hypothetical protein GX131_13660 [candidate division WS1 bacterium]|jgi:flagellar basal body-associated protein FliL|nr:hypothetical protein [candidate division WS1 bacterium]
MRMMHPRRGSKLLTLTVFVMALVMLGGGVFAWTHLRGSGGPTAGNAAEKAAGVAEATDTYSLGAFLVNLGSADGTLRYLQAEISIVASGGAKAEATSAEGGHGADGGQAEEEPQLPAATQRYARDVAIEVLSAQSFEGLRAQGDRSKLKGVLQEELDAALEDYTVSEVLFTAFVMQ